MSEVGAAYDAAAQAWQGRPAQVYERLAAALVDTVPELVRDARVLDLGSGPGPAAAHARRLGARTVVACDLAPAMLAHRATGVQAVAADAALLPFGDDSFDLVLAAMLLAHLPDVRATFAGTRRVAPVLRASAFEGTWQHPAKAAVEEAMARFGYNVPSWYRDLKRASPDVEDPARLAGIARDAGYPRVAVDQVEVDVGLREPADLVDWRWAMAHLAPFVATLAPSARAEARADAEAAVAGMPPVVVRLLLLTAR